MKIGDLVGKISNPWVEKNPWMKNSLLRSELLQDGPSGTYGIIIADGLHANPRSVLVLKTDGKLIDISINQLEVLNETTNSLR